MACVSAQSCPTLCILVDCSPPGSSVHGISQARIQDWLAISYSRGSSQPKDGTHVSCISCIGRWVLYNSATWEAQQGINIKFLIVGKLKISFRLKRCCCSVSKSSLTLQIPWTAAYLSFTISQSLLKFMSIESVMPFNHLILCCLPPSPPALSLSQHHGLFW